MTKEEIRQRIAAINAEKRALFAEADASNDVEEIRKIGTKMDQLNDELMDLDEQFYEAPDQRTAAPISEARILGTYVMRSAQQTQTITKNSEVKKMYNTEADERRDSEQYRSAFHKVMTGKATLEERALVTLSTGAAVIPTKTFDQIVENAQKAQGLISRIRVLNIPGKLTIPASDITTAATWHEEGSEISESNTPPSSVTLTGFELAKLFSLSAATQAMSIAAFESYLVTELGRAMRDALSDSIINGVGVTQPTGILPGTVWGADNSVTYASTPAVTDLTKAMRLLPANFRQNAVWACNSAYFYDVLAPVADANGHPLFAKDLSSGAPSSLLGKAVIIDDFMPDNTILFGDPSAYFMNFSAQIAVERSTEAGFTTGTVLYRGLAVVDGKPAAPAFVKVSKA